MEGKQCANCKGWFKHSQLKTVPRRMVTAYFNDRDIRFSCRGCLMRREPYSIF